MKRRRISIVNISFVAFSAMTAMAAAMPVVDPSPLAHASKRPAFRLVGKPRANNDRQTVQINAPRAATVQLWVVQAGQKKFKKLSTLKLRRGNQTVTLPLLHRGRYQLEIRGKGGKIRTSLVVSSVPKGSPGATPGGTPPPITGDPALHNRQHQGNHTGNQNQQQKPNQPNQITRRVGGVEVELTRVGITNLNVDVITDALNPELVLGSGIAAAIRKAGGVDNNGKSKIQAELDSYKARQPNGLLKGIQSGEVMYTGAGDLQQTHGVRFIIHAASVPGSGMRTTAAIIREATKNTLLRARFLARQHNVSTLAIPAFGTGVGGIKFDVAADQQLTELKSFLQNGTTLKKIVFSLVDAKAFDAFHAKLNELFPE